MRDKLTPGLEKAGKSAESLGGTAEKVARSITERISAQKEQIKYVENNLKELKKQYDKLAPGKAQLELRAEIEACTKALQEDKAILAALEEQHKKTETSTKRLSAELRGLLDSMARMRLEGKQNTAEYREMASKAATLSDTIGDLRTQTNILAHDDAGLQGVISAVGGLSGAVTAATGIMGVFASENEDLAKIQTRVQSVMAVTMGLQQVFNTLNKDSAFRLVTVRKAKELLTAANTRLATSLRISNAAASALMGTLTLGLSVAVALAVSAWDKYSEAQEKAAEKARELREIENDGMAQMLRTRVEIDNTIEALGNFVGTKEQERAKVDELNRKYGESFGYYDTVAKWYDTLTSKAESYIQIMYLQAKSQSLLNKAVEADEKVRDVESTDAGEVDGALGWWGKAWRYAAQVASGGQLDAAAQIEKYNNNIKESAIKAARDSRDAFLNEIQDINNEIAKIGRESGIGNHADPGRGASGTDTWKTLAEMELAAARRIEDMRVDIIRDGYERQRAEAELNFEREKQRIAQEEQKRVELYNKLEAAGGKVSPGQLATIHAQAATQKIMAAQAYSQALEAINGKEDKEAGERRKRQEQELRDLLAKYRDYEARRAEVKRQGDDDIAALESKRTEANSTEIDRAIAIARDKVREGLQVINDEEARAAREGNDFMRRLFGDYAAMNLESLQKLVGEARQLRDYLSGTGDRAGGLTFISDDQLEKIEASPAELDKLKKALDRLLDGGKDKNNKWVKIFEDMRVGIAGLRGGRDLKDVASSAGAIAESASLAATELSAMLESVGADAVGEAVGNIAMLSTSVANIGKGFAQGGTIGGIGAALETAANIASSILEAESRHREALKEIERSRIDFQRQYNLLLIEQKLLMEEAANVFGDKEIARAANAVDVYREVLSKFKAELGKGDAPRMTLKERATGDAAGTYRRRLEAYESGLGGIAGARIVTGHKKTGLFGWGKGKDTYSGLLEVYPELVKANGELDTEMLRVILDTRKMSDETRSYLENLLELRDAMEEAEDALESYLGETFGSLGEGIMDAVTAALSGSGDALEIFAGDAARVLERLGEQVAYSLFFADRFEELQEQLKGIYGSGRSEEDIGGDAMRLLDDFYGSIGKNVEEARGWMQAWKDKAAALGYDLWGTDNAGTSQSGRAGVYTALSQDQGTKLEGLFTSVQMHAAHIDETLDGFMEAFGGLCDTINKILKNTDCLKQIADDIHDVRTDGVKLRE